MTVGQAMTVDDQVRAIRSGGGIVDRTGRGIVRVTGPDRAPFLQGVLSADIAALAAGRGATAFLLTPKAQPVAYLHVWAAADSILLDTDPDLGAALPAALGRYLVMEDANLRDETADTGVAELLAPDLAGHDRLDALACRPHGPGLVCGLRYGSLPALRLIGPRAAVAAWIDEAAARGAARVSPEAIEVVRIEAGVPRWGAEILPDRFPLEVAPEAVSLTKGCFVGQEPIARVTARGHLRLSLRALAHDGDPLAPGTALSGGGRDDAARVTSSCRSPTLGRALALALVRTGMDAPGTDLVAPDGRIARVIERPAVA